MNILLSVGKRVEQTSITPKCGTYGSSFKLQIHTLKANLESYNLSIIYQFYSVTLLVLLPIKPE